MTRRGEGVAEGELQGCDGEGGKDRSRGCLLWRRYFSLLFPPPPPASAAVLSSEFGRVALQDSVDVRRHGTRGGHMIGVNFRGDGLF